MTLNLALTWAAVSCHVTVTGAVAIIAAVNATVLVIGTCILPIVWQPQLVQRLTHAEKARPATRRTTVLSIKNFCLHKSLMKEHGVDSPSSSLQQGDISS